jgi:hypothetical protein
MWFKLALNTMSFDNSYLASQLPDENELPPSYDKTPADLTTDYLMCLRNHNMSVLESSLGSTIVRSTPIRYIITVPAIWMDKAKALTLKCARKAGMGEVIMIVSEPEAAAIYTLHARGTSILRKGDKLVVFDAGGGTVDVVSLRIESEGTPVEVSQIVAGSGDCCGASFLNRMFRKMMIQRCSQLQGYNEEVLADAEEYFADYIKERYAGHQSYKIKVHPMKDDVAAGIKGGKLYLSATDIEAIFAPVVSAAITVLTQQVGKTPGVRAVLMVGGFSDSPYLRKRIRELLPKTIELIMPPNGRTAVVRGALMKAMAEELPALSRINITSRAARKYYGYALTVRYDASIHPADKKWWSAYYGRDRVTIMDWRIKEVCNYS